MKKRLLLSLLSFQMAATLLVGCGTTSEEAVPKSSGSENSESTESTEAGETENSETATSRRPRSPAERTGAGCR